PLSRILAPSAGNFTARSSSSSRTVPPSASTSRSPPVCSRSVGGILTTLMPAPVPAKPAPPLLGRLRRAYGSRVSTAGAELDVVDVLGDRRRFAADRAGGIAAQRDLVERRGQRVEEEQAADQRRADSQRELQRLVRLQRADDAGQDAEDTALRARRRELGRRRLWKEAAVAGALVRLEDRDLALEAVDRTVHDRDPVPDRRADQEDARVEQLQLAFLADLRDQQVPAVAPPPLRLERPVGDGREAVALPAVVAGRERRDVRVAELLERLDPESGAVAGRAVEDD